MFTKLSILGVAMIITAPAWAATSAATAATPSGGRVAAASGGTGSSGGGGHGPAGLGAHTAALSTHTSAAAHTLHGTTAHIAENKRVAMSEGTAKKNKDNGSDHEKHIFLHRNSNESPPDWMRTCILTIKSVDNSWSDCDRPGKSSSGAHP